MATSLLVIILLFYLQSAVLVISQNLTCNSNDLRGLMGFMNGMISPIDGWWSSNCCHWVGVTCNSSNGRIVKLQLPNKRLTGNLSDSVSNLDQLRTLNLSYNSLKGPLPVSLFHLACLETVDLSGNEFNGILPVSINLPALQVLDISDNSFRGFLPSSLCLNSSRIRVASFSVNYFTGTIRPQFGNCTSLENLFVASNFHSGVIPDFLLRLPRLRELALQDNMFTSIAGIGNFSSQLDYIDVSDNMISGNIPDFFDNFPNLSYFSAHSNGLSGGIPPSLSNSQTISSLNLRNNSLHGSFYFNCSMMVNLTSLNLGTNNFSGTIPSNLASCLKLKSINLSRNKLLTGHIPESFKNFKSLSYLSLSNCSLSNISTSLEILQHCRNLTVLVLSINFNSEHLPSDDDLHFKVLKVLVMADCSLTGSIPSWLNGLKQLQVLDLSWNHLTGSIPAYLGEFKFLFYLDLANNSLSGEIPKSLTHLQSLISRDTSLDEPSSEFPLFRNRDTSSRQSILQYNQIMRLPPLIDLSSNLLTGPVWAEFGNLKKLHVLDLKHNTLSGTIPSSLSGMRSIEMLDLSYNSLGGRIPVSLGNLYFLSKFSVAYNNLAGSIPSIGQLSTFSISSFEGNPGLCGHFFLNCQINEDLLQTPKFENNMQTPESENSEGYIMRLVILMGFGTGFLVTVISLLVIPRIRVSHG